MKAIFLTEPHIDFPNTIHYNMEVIWNLQRGLDDLITTDLSILSFDLLTHWGFDEIYLYHNGQRYKLKLGNNTWTSKELRESHNLLKLVKSNILNS